MKKYISIFGLLVVTMSMAQNGIGINTTNPQQVFHIDGAKDNPATGVPDASTAQRNDMVVTKDGFVGIGTSAPQKRVHIVSGTPGAIKIVDGNQGIDRVLTSDENGFGTWKETAVFKDAVLGKFFKTTYDSLQVGYNEDPLANTGTPLLTESGKTTNKYNYLKAMIKLKKGKWIVNVGTTLKSKIARTDIEWVHMYLTSNYKDLNTISNTGWRHLGSAGNQTAFAGMLHGYKSTEINKDDNDNFVSGSSIIEVTAPEVRIYLMIDNIPDTITYFAGGSENTGQKYYTMTDYWENYFYAVPVN